jgi:hypothetical protein
MGKHNNGLENGVDLADGEITITAAERVKTKRARKVSIPSYSWLILL